MYATHCTRQDLENAAGLKWVIDLDDEGSRIHFTLKHYASSNSKELHGMKRTPNFDGSPGNRTNSLCVHEHYYYFKRLFDIAPEAVVKSSWYGHITHTKETLYDNYMEMRYMEVRKFDGLLLDDCCNCPEDYKP